MSTTDPTGFGKFVPGFEFLQSLGKGAAASLPAMNSWVAPTLDPKVLDKRIEELKAVQFWLDQNATALRATIQALEVQKMTLATLKGMNFNPPDLAQAFKPAAAAPQAPTPASPAKTAAPRKPRAAAGAKGSSAKATAAPTPDPMQFWGALTQQFQQIASHAMKEAASKLPSAPQDAIKKEAAGAGKTRAGGTKVAKKSAAKSAAKSAPRRR
ncbi:MAG: PhaM family polyhydroxyalkanoate granule multifunctional regulatory protein [Pseudomonadota bacterium]|nr:PhaM family polyhydroxyalkanoate granule multifunctional regulatory protein [Pseudomonadota bacterium]